MPAALLATRIIHIIRPVTQPRQGANLNTPITHRLYQPSGFLAQAALDTDGLVRDVRYELSHSHHDLADYVPLASHL